MGAEVVAARPFQPYLINREPARSMSPGEFVSILQRHKHPRFWSIGVESTIYGSQARETVGLSAPAGTVWAAEANVYHNGTQFVQAPGGREWFIQVPKNELPYVSVKDAWWDENISRWRGGEMKRGWTVALEQLLQAGMLLAHPKLSYLLGKDTTKIMPKEFQIW